MAFWGAEVKLGKPITHSCEEARGRLRISQATLGMGVDSKKSVVQCNVGNGRPVVFCVLLPGQTESCHLDLEFEEADDVVFSVLGPRSVFLTGYYLRQNHHSYGHSHTESYGVDIENTQTSRSSCNSDYDGPYESSFIDDDDLQVSPGSSVSGSQGLEEVTMEKEPKERKGCGKPLKKKRWVIESDDDANLLEKEDKNCFSFSLDDSKRDVKTTTCDTEEKTARVTFNMDDEAKDDDVNCNETKQNADPLHIRDKIDRVSPPLLDEGVTELINGKDQRQSLDILRFTIGLKPRRKRKRRFLLEKTSEGLIDDEDSTIPIERKEHESEASADPGVIESDAVNGRKLKKTRTELLPGNLTEGTDEKSQNITEYDFFKQGLQQADGVTEHQLADNGEYERQQKSDDSSMENFCAKYHNVQREDEALQEAHADSETEDLPAETGQIQIDRAKSTLLANDNQLGQKIKKKKKTRGKKDSNMSVIHMLDNQENEGQSIQTVPFDKRTLLNGLTIEELASGPPGGKVAVRGKNVKIYYNGMLKESGHVFDSNVGKAAYKFVLGDEDIIEGWNVGIHGMHVGDKRRLIIPPSMGFGDDGLEDIVPPDAWVVYDIELVSVRR